MNGRLDVAHAAAASHQDEVRSGGGPSGSSVFPLKREREKKGGTVEMLWLAAPAGVWGLLASHNGGSRDAAYLSAAGGLPGDKNTIHVYGNPRPSTTPPPVTHVLVCNLL